MSLLNFASLALCVASQLVFIVVHFVIDSVTKLLDTPSYTLTSLTSSKTAHRSYKNIANSLKSETLI
jgi:hypothetical protein